MSGMVAIANKNLNRFICPLTSGPLNFTEEEYMEDVRLQSDNTEQGSINPIRVHIALNY